MDSELYETVWCTFNIGIKCFISPLRDIASHVLIVKTIPKDLFPDASRAIGILAAPPPPPPLSLPLPPPGEIETGNTGTSWGNREKVRKIISNQKRKKGKKEEKNFILK